MTESGVTALRFKGESVSCAICGLYMRVTKKGTTDSIIAIHPQDGCENGGKRFEWTKAAVREVMPNEKLPASVLYQVVFISEDGDEDGAWLVRSDLMIDDLQAHLTTMLADRYWGRAEVKQVEVITLDRLNKEIEENLYLEDDEQEDDGEE